MDHSIAEIIDTTIKSKVITECDFTFADKEEALSRSENLMHNKRQQKIEAYYKKIADAILTYDHVLLFGPTNAKTELHNYINLHFKDIKFDVKPADKMTENEKIAFVKDHFNN